MISRPRIVISPADAAKLEDIWKNHASTVLAMLKTFCSSPEDAQDALQELFLRIGKNPSIVESAKSPRAFLIVSARRIAIDLARKRAAEQTRLESPEAAESLHPLQAPVKNDPEVEAAISSAVQKLPSEQRAVFIAKIIQGKTLAVIAAEQNITLNTAASRLRYSLDKIRSRLRPHYEAMKNQNKTSMKNTLSDSPERLIKPLEPKRVPSVVPGLEGVAAMATDDSDSLCVFLPPEIIEEVEGVAPTESSELPTDSIEYVEEAIIEEVEVTDEPAEETENLPTDESIQVVDTSEIPEVAICELPPPAVENFEEPVLIVCERFIDPPTIDLPPENPEQVDLNEQTTDGILEEIFVEEAPTEPGSDNEFGENWTEYAEIDDGTEVEETPTAEGGEDILGEYHNDLLNEYKGFLAENPDWITENSGGDMHAQVITPSQHTGLDFSDPGAAQAFDIWFYDNYIAPYENLVPVEGGSLNLGGQPFEYGTVVKLDQPDRTGIPEAWMRGSTAQLSGGGEIAFNTSAPSQTMVSSGASVANQPVSATSAVEEFARITVNNQASGPVNYQFTADAVASTELTPTSTEPSSDKVVTEAQSVSQKNQPINFNAVVPIVSGSDEVIDSQSNDRPVFAENSRPTFASVELPSLVETKVASSSEESHMTDDISFTDDDSFAPTPTTEASPVDAVSNAPAKTDVAAAVGGAFAVGTATQAAPARGASVKKGISA